MDDDELRARLRRADPARDDHPADSWIDDLVEATMETESTDVRTSETNPRQRSRWLAPLAAAAAVAAVAAGGFALVGGDDDSGGKDAEDPTVVALTMPAVDSMQMCMQFSVDALRPMDLAFEGTATEVAGEQVTLDVDKWFKGGDADAVELTSSTDMGILLEGGVEFAEGERYLVTATGGTVNGCGFSGKWSADMAAAYAEAFGG